MHLSLSYSVYVSVFMLCYMNTSSVFMCVLLVSHLVGHQIVGCYILMLVFKKLLFCSLNSGPQHDAGSCTVPPLSENS